MDVASEDDQGSRAVDVDLSKDIGVLANDDQIVGCSGVESDSERMRARPRGRDQNPVAAIQDRFDGDA